MFGEPVGDDLLADHLVGVVVGGVEVAERDLGDDHEADAGDGEQQDRADLAAAAFVGAAVGAAHRVERDAGDEGDQDRRRPRWRRSAAARTPAPTSPTASSTNPRTAPPRRVSTSEAP